MPIAHLMGLARIPLAFAACVCLLGEDFSYRISAVIIVAAAIITDMLDGALARRFGTVSSFGAILDATTDKLFICPVLFLAGRDNAVILGMACVITIREFLVLGMRAYVASCTKDVIPARTLGKLKTIVTFPAILLIVLKVHIGIWLLGIGVFLAIASAIEYFYCSRTVFTLALFPASNIKKNSNR